MLSETYLTMDTKRRIAIPTKCRKVATKSVVLTRNLVRVYRPVSVKELGSRRDEDSEIGETAIHQ